MIHVSSFERIKKFDDKFCCILNSKTSLYFPEFKMKSYLNIIHCTVSSLNTNIAYARIYNHVHGKVKGNEIFFFSLWVTHRT